jgi:hypothetical protein
MADQEINETAAPEKKEGCCCRHKCSFMHKVFGLKGLSIIYKVISAFLMLYLLYILFTIWYLVFKEGAPKLDALLGSLQFIITYGFYALVMLTVSRVLKVLKKIRHAVEHK